MCVGSRAIKWTVLASVALISACGSDREPASSVSDAAASDGGASDSGVSAVLAPPAAGKGIQVKFTDTVGAGVDTERCKFYQVPAAGMNIVESEVKYTPGSHHVLVYSTTYKEIPAKTIRGAMVDTKDVFDCIDGPLADWDVVGLVGGSQSPDSPPTLSGLPEGTAVKVAGGSVLLVNAHYLNTASTSVSTDVYINFHTIADDKVTQEAGVFLFYNPIIRVEAASTAIATQRCVVSKDITMVLAQSHMHRRGVGFESRIIDTMTGKTEDLIMTTKWEDVQTQHFKPAKSLKKDNLIEWTCKYANKENRTVVQGRSTRDEMCVLAGAYYPRDPKTEYCSINNDASGRYIGGLWVGSGTQGGMETAACLQGAKPIAMDAGDSFNKCVIDSCPKITRETSDVVRCLFSGGLGMCGKECSGTDAAACGKCVGTTCGPFFAKLATVSCQ